MPRGKRKPREENSLLAALRFVAIAQRANGAPEQMYCRMFGNWLMAANGVLSAAHPISEDSQLCPHTFLLMDALEQAQGAVSLTQLEAARLSVRSGDFLAIIPCVEQAQLPAIFPDQPVALCDNRLRDALLTVGTLATDTAPKVIQSTVQLRGQSVIGSDGAVILEAWHGVAMPPLAIIPKTFVTALAKTTKTIARAGASENSLTLWFEDGSWLKTQLHASDTPLPNLVSFLDVPTSPVPVPKNLFKVARMLQPFSHDGRIDFTDEGAKVESPLLLSNAETKIEGVPPGIAFHIKSLLSIESLAKVIHFNAAPGITLFFGDNLRGAIVNK